MEMRRIGWKGVLHYKMDHKNPNMAAHIAQGLTVAQGMSTTTESSPSKQRIRLQKR